MIETHSENSGRSIGRELPAIRAARAPPKPWCRNGWQLQIIFLHLAQIGFRQTIVPFFVCSLSVLKKEKLMFTSRIAMAKMLMVVVLPVAMTAALAGSASAVVVFEETFDTGTPEDEITTLGWTFEVKTMSVDATTIDVGNSMSTSGPGSFPRYLKNFDSVHAVSAANPAELKFHVKEPGTLGSVFSMAMRLFSAADGTGDYLTIKMDANPPSDRFITMHTSVGGSFTALPTHAHTQTEGRLRITTDPSGTTFELQDPGTGNWTTTGFKDVGLSSVASVRLITDNTGGFMDSVVVNLVPEPSTWLLLGIGLLTLAFFRRRGQ